jgi:hypothetical protein
MDKQLKNFAVQFLGVNKYTSNKNINFLFLKMLSRVVHELKRNDGKVTITQKELKKEYVIVDTEFYEVRRKRIKS